VPCCCRWGYQNISVLEDVVANYSKAGIPLDCMWLDIEYMGNRFRTLTFDERECCAERRVLVLWGTLGGC